MAGSLVTDQPLVRLLAALVTGAALSLTGCGRTSITEPLAVDIASSEGVVAGELDEIEFWHTLPTRTVVANGDAMLGLIFLATGGSPEDIPVTELVGTDYAQRVEYAKRRGWLSEDFNEPPDLAVRRGIVARALTDICRVKGGVMMRVLGPTERYSARELEYLGVMAPGSTNQVVAGGEFVGLISQAQDYVNFKRFEPLPGVNETLFPGAPMNTTHGPEAGPGEAAPAASEPPASEPEVSKLPESEQR